MYKIDETIYQRFREKNNMIYRRLWDKALPTFGKMFEVNIENHINSHKEGYGRLDFALVAQDGLFMKNFLMLSHGKEKI